jgi:hypothetical protein
MRGQRVASFPASGLRTTVFCRGCLRPNRSRKTIAWVGPGMGRPWSASSTKCVVHEADGLRMPEASQPVAGRWSGSDTTGKLPPICASRRDASRAVCSIKVARSFFWSRFFGGHRGLHPCRGALRGPHKTGVVAHARPPATDRDASGISFGYPRLLFGSRKMGLRERVRFSLIPRGRDAKRGVPKNKGHWQTSSPV